MNGKDFIGNPDKRNARIENWSIFNLADISNPLSLSGGYTSLLGDVYGHGSFDDGIFIVSSNIVKIDIPNNLVETMNTNYDLGKIDLQFLTFLSKSSTVDRSTIDLLYKKV